MLNLLKRLLCRGDAGRDPGPQKGAISIGAIRSRAERYYRDGDYYCSEAIVKTILDAFCLEVGDDAIAMSSGFAVGVGGSKCLCGAVAGGCLCIGMAFGRTRAGDRSIVKTMALARELHDAFRLRNRALCCRVLTRGLTRGSKAHLEQCARFTGEVAADTARIMAREMNWRIEA